LFVAATLFTAGCADDPNEPYPGEVRKNSTLANAISCDFETACPDGLVCAYVSTTDGDGPVCVDLETVCDDLNCESGECLVAESYPVQIFCAGPGGDHDDCNGDEPVCSDGDCGEPGGTSPGDPGDCSDPEGCSTPGSPGE
jgi:hypothetical protein